MAVFYTKIFFHFIHRYISRMVSKMLHLLDNLETSLFKNFQLKPFVEPLCIPKKRIIVAKIDSGSF